MYSALLANVPDEWAGWAIISTLAALLITFIATSRRDWNRNDSDAVARWKLIAETMTLRADAYEKRVTNLLQDRTRDREEIARLREEIKHLKQDSEQ
jgi:poly(3-hydroxybutyrate) depolymerase